MIWLVGISTGLLALSPLVTDAIGVPRVLLWLASCMLMVVATFRRSLRPRRPRLFGAVLVAMVFLGALSYALFKIPRAVAIPVIPLLPLLFITQCRPHEQLRVVQRLSVILLLLLAGAWLGLLYYLLGGPPLYSFQQYDGRISELYLTTLSVTVEQGFMRASSLFDEPGALSLIVTVIACLRILFKQPPATTVALMALGLVTGSVAHVICLLMVFLHLAIAGRWWRRIKPVHAVVAAVLVLPLAVVSYQVLLAPRLVETASGDRLEADTRTPLVLRSLLLLDQASAVTGLDQGLCYFDPAACVEEYGIFLESPLGPYLALGLPGSLLYYAFLTIAIILAFRRRSLLLIHLTIVALFLQRPYVMNLGYCVLVGMYVAAVSGLALRRHRVRKPLLRRMRSATL